MLLSEVSLRKVGTPFMDLLWAVKLRGLWSYVGLTTICALSRHFDQVYYWHGTVKTF